VISSSLGAAPPKAEILVFRDPALDPVPESYLLQISEWIYAFFGQAQLDYYDPTLLKQNFQDAPELQEALQAQRPTEQQIRAIVTQTQAAVYITFGFQRREGQRYVFLIKAFDASTAEAFAISPPQYLRLDSQAEVATQEALTEALKRAFEGPQGLFVRLQEHLQDPVSLPLVLRFHFPRHHLRTIYVILKKEAKNIILQHIEPELVVFEIKAKSEFDMEELLVEIAQQLNLKIKEPLKRENRYDIYLE